jgi:hypothetical protein
MLVPRSGLWRGTDFLKLWGGQAVSHLGSQITLLALPLLARAAPLSVEGG